MIVTLFKLLNLEDRGASLRGDGSIGHCPVAIGPDVDNPNGFLSRECQMVFKWQRRSSYPGSVSEDYSIRSGVIDESLLALRRTVLCLNVQTRGIVDCNVIRRFSDDRSKDKSRVGCRGVAYLERAGAWRGRDELSKRQQRH